MFSSGYRPNKLGSSALLLAVAASLCATAQAQTTKPDELKRAQGAMLMRAMDAMDAYAERLQLDPSYVTYCRLKMELETTQYPANGFEPFGTNYNTIADMATMNRVLAQREAFEVSSVKLCLANARTTLDAAERPR